MTGAVLPQVDPNVADIRRQAPFMLLLPMFFTFTGCIVWFGGVGASTTLNLVPSTLIGVGYVWAMVLILTRPEFGSFALRSMPYFMPLVAFIGISAFWSGFPLRVGTNTGHYLGVLFSSVCAGYFAVYRMRDFFSSLFLYLMLIVLISILVSRYAPTIGIDPLIGRWRGITSHPNNLGIVSWLAAWAGIVLLLGRNSIYLKLLVLSSMGLVALSLEGSRSITSIVQSLMIVGITAALSILLYRSNALRMITYALSGVTAFVLLGGIAYLNQRPDVALVLNLFFKITGRDMTLTGRTELWAVAIEAIKQRPILGWSFDSLNTVLGRFHEMSYAQFHNGYLDLAVRGGTVGWLLFGLVFMRFMFMAWVAYRRKLQSAVVAVPFVLTWMAGNFTEASFVRETHLLWQFFVFTFFLLSWDLCFAKTRAEPPVLARNMRASPKIIR